MPALVDLSTEFVGRRALITGGSRGIGAAVAQRLLDAGAKVVIVARNPHRQTPAQALFIEADLSSIDGTGKAAQLALAELGGLDILVNNAGAGEPQLPDSSAITDGQWLDALNINFLCAVRLTAALLPALKQSANAAIVNVSALTRSPAPGPALHYLCAKAALNTYSLGLGRELAAQGIRVNVLTPGPVATPGGDGFRRIITDAMGLPAGALAGQVPLGRLGEPAEVAEMVAMLVSDRGRWLTMHNYFVDGGMAAL